MHTGDVGRFDDDGYLYIVDRTKDMVITGGFNVFPREVEDVISTHSAVSMVMVIGVPDDKWGEAVKAVVVLRPGHEPTDELTESCNISVRDAKGSQQSPKSIDYVDALPLTPVGKPDKKAVGPGTGTTSTEQCPEIAIWAAVRPYSGVGRPDWCAGRWPPRSRTDQAGGSARSPTSSNSVVSGTTLPSSSWL